MRIVIVSGIVLQLALISPSFSQTGSGGGASGGGALGSSAASPGTNSAGTAAPSGGAATGASVATGTGDPATDKQDKEVKSICKGC